MQSTVFRFAQLMLALAGTMAGARTAAAAPAAAATTDDDGRFAVADVSPTRAPKAVLDRIERETAARRPGLQPLDDVSMRTLLRDAEPVTAVANRRLSVARERRLAGDCPAALNAAAEVESQALDTMTLDEQRAPLREVYSLVLLCEHALGHEERAEAAARSLRHLTKLRPDDVPEALWERYAGTAAQVGEAELRIDSDPPNAHVTVNFHDTGLYTPCTVKQPQGQSLVQLEKRGYRRAFRRVTGGTEPTRVSFTLAERRLDRATSVRDLIVALRGREPDRDRAVLARLAQLARADVLVLVSAAEGTVRVWTFDVERGEITSTSRPMEAVGKI